MDKIDELKRFYAKTGEFYILYELHHIESYYNKYANKSWGENPYHKTYEYIAIKELNGKMIPKDRESVILFSYPISNPYERPIYEDVQKELMRIHSLYTHDDHNCLITGYVEDEEGYSFEYINTNNEDEAKLLAECL